jgi:hypothetical protein
MKKTWIETGWFYLIPVAFIGQLILAALLS